jgi:hypothetical protein
MAALMVGQSFGLAATHGSHQRIGGAQVDTRRQTTLVRRGTQPGSLICNKAIIASEN